MTAAWSIVAVILASPVGNVGQWAIYSRSHWMGRGGEGSGRRGKFSLLKPHPRRPGYRVRAPAGQASFGGPLSVISGYTLPLRKNMSASIRASQGPYGVSWWVSL